MHRLSRLGALATVGLALVLIVILGPGTAPDAALAQDGEGATHGDDLAPLRGAAVYAEFCQACHGLRGEATGTAPSFVAIRYREAAARRAVTEGVPPAGDGSAVMPAFGAVLSAEQVEDVLAYMGTWDSGEVPALPAPNVPDVPGAATYARYCAGCHGAQGAGRGVPGFPPLKEDLAQAAAIAANGRGTMPGFSVEAGGPLSAQQIDEVAHYIGTWAAESEEKASSQRGLSAMIVLTGVVALLIVGAVYIVRKDTGGPAAEQDTEV